MTKKKEQEQRQVVARNEKSMMKLVWLPIWERF